MTSLRLPALCRRCLAALLAIIAGLICTAPTMAQGNQFGAPSIQRPTTSPYLNLFQGTNRAMDLGLNYQRRVRPEQDLRNYAARNNQQIGNLQQQFNTAIAPDGTIILPGTGHQTSFMNTRGYFSGGAATRGPMPGNSSSRGNTQMQRAPTSAGTAMPRRR
jgi:hypothetical protein